MKEFVVYFTIYTGNTDLPPFYIGSSSYKKVMAGYSGSIESKRWKTLYKSEKRVNPDKFDTIILEFCDTRKSALERELIYQKQNDVINNPSFSNESYATVNGFFGNSEMAAYNSLGNTNVLGRVWVNNGEESKMVSPDKIPIGYHLGRSTHDINQIKKTKRKKDTHIWITNGTTSTRILKGDTIPDGYRIGRQSSIIEKMNSGERKPYRWYNNPNTGHCIRIYDDMNIPCGYELGRGKQFSNKVKCTLTNIRRK